MPGAQAAHLPSGAPSFTVKIMNWYLTQRTLRYRGRWVCSQSNVRDPAYVRALSALYSAAALDLKKLERIGIWTLEFALCYFSFALRWLRTRMANIVDLGSKSWHVSSLHVTHPAGKL